jgi:hypothetical protein
MFESVPVVYPLEVPVNAYNCLTRLRPLLPCCLLRGELRIWGGGGVAVMIFLAMCMVMVILPYLITKYGIHK